MGRVEGTLAWQKAEVGCRSGFPSSPHSPHHKTVSFLVQFFHKVSCSPVRVLLHPSQRTKLVPSIQVCIWIRGGREREPLNEKTKRWLPSLAGEGTGPRTAR